MLLKVAAQLLFLLQVLYPGSLTFYTNLSASKPGQRLGGICEENEGKTGLLSTLLPQRGFPKNVIAIEI